MLRLIMALCLFVPVTVQAQINEPELYRVIGGASVEAVDVREYPDGEAADLGDLEIGQYIEILDVSEDGNWALVSPEGGVGWVQVQFLEEARSGYNYLPSLFTCSSSEPFWDAEIITGKTLITYESDGYQPSYNYAGESVAKEHAITSFVGALNRNIKFAFQSPPYTGVLTHQICDDGMSESIYGWTLDLIYPDGEGIFCFRGVARRYCHKPPLTERSRPFICLPLAVL